MPDLDEACRQDVKEKTPYELFGCHGDTPFLAGVVVVPGVEGDGSVCHTDEAVVGYGNLVSIATQVGEDVFGPGKRLFCVEVPVLEIELFHERVECFAICEILNASLENDLTLMVGLFEQVNKLSSNLEGQGLYRDQELVA